VFLPKLQVYNFLIIKVIALLNRRVILLCIIKKKKPIMSLEKSIKRLTQVIQAAKLGCVGLQRCTTMPRGGRTVCECQQLDASCQVVTNGRVTITEGPCAQQGDIPVPPQTPRRPSRQGPETVDTTPTEEPPNGWTCYWALKAMQDNPNKMSDMCFDPHTPIPHTRIDYYRDTPGGPIKTRESRQD
jgi:hypothetical protein